MRLSGASAAGGDPEPTHNYIRVTRAVPAGGQPGEIAAVTEPTALAPPPGFRGIFRTDSPARAGYSEAAGIARITPRAVAVPADAADVVTLVKWAHATQTPLVPRGSGSSMAGGAIGDGVIVDLSRLDAIGPVEQALPSASPIRREGLAPDVVARVTAGPGALRNDVDAAAARSGLRFPVDPSSGAYCTVGGMAATNAAGAHTLRCGAMRAWVIGLDCVFEDGSRAWLRRGEPAPARIPAVERLLAWGATALQGDAAIPRRPGVRKESSGYALAAWAGSGELVDLLVGSEGTLALFVQLELALERRPAHSASVLAGFASLDDAVVAAGRVREAGAAACELLDRTFLEVAASGRAPLPIPAGTEAALLIEVERDSRRAADAWAASIDKECWATGATHVVTALTPRDEETLWALRHAASPMLAALDPALASMQFIEDGCVPPYRLADYVRGVRAALDRHGVRGVIFGHAGDAHVHVNPLIDVRRPSWRADVAALLEEISTLTNELGGTLSGEHGDGRLRAPLLEANWGTGTVALFAEVKRAADPAGILNPGAIVPVAGQRAIADVKYDPSLPVLPPAARRALETVAATRGYARFRLQLVDDATASLSGTTPVV
jgi:FAD/FMN-containing dehydrogenase